MAQFRITGPDGKQYNVTAPDGASENDVLQYVQANAGKPDMGSPQGPDRSVGEQAVRLAGMGAKGIADSALETVGAVPDAVAAGLRAIGAPAPEPGFYTNKLKSAWNTVGGAMAAPVNQALRSQGVDLGKESAENTLERAAYGGGRGVADAASLYLPAAGVAKMAGPGVAQGVAATLASQPALQTVAGAAGGAVGEATDSPLLGAATAMAVPVLTGVGQRLANPVRSSLSPEQARLAEVAAQEGIGLTPGQQTGSRPLQAMESVFGTMPLTSGPQKVIQEAQQKAFNEAVLKRAGIEANQATPEVLGSQKKTLGKVFEDIAKRNVLDFNQSGLTDDLINTSYEASRRLSNPGPIQNTIDDILKDVNANGVMDGTKYQAWRSTLGQMAKGSDTEAMFAGQVKKALDNAFTGQVAVQDAEAWKAASRQYSNLKTILNAMGGAGNVANSGNISPAQLSQALTSAVGREGKALGRGDLNDLAKVGNMFVRDNVPNSGTAERSLMANLLTGGIAGGVGVGIDPLLGVGTLLAPRAAQMAYNTGPVQQWLTQGAKQAGPGTLSPVALAQLKQQLIAQQLQQSGP